MIKIVIMDKGFVSVGVWTEGPEWCVLDNAQIVRYWGTTKGLGEIAEGGPTSATKLDPTPRQRFPLHSIVNTIECNEEKWRGVLGVEVEVKKKAKKSPTRSKSTSGPAS